MDFGYIIGLPETSGYISEGCIQEGDKDILARAKCCFREEIFEKTLNDRKTYYDKLRCIFR